ncbi:MAG TPA: glycosyltransferase family 4 protein [Candidatus Limnocylindrales bacterium]|nr:glycosyltransferase family 4 protein [Candidatus Limnocylindrales bacterium]
MIVHAYYEEDPRVRREAESLAAAGRPVLVLSLKRPELPAEEVLQGVHVRRLDEQRHQGAGLGTYLREYVSFVVRSGWAAVKLHRRHRFGLVQVHSLPDFLVFAALPLKLVGVPVVLDLHEAMPEFFVTRFPRAANPISHRLLLLQERLSMAFATHVVTVNEAFGDRLRKLGLRDDKLSIVINSPSLERFDAAAHQQRVFREDGMLKLVYTGALTPTYELDVTIRAIARIATERPDLDVRLELYGRGDSEEELRALAAELGVRGRVTFHGRIPIDAVPAAVAAADMGIAPTRLDRFTAMTISGKIYEYGAMGKPVVASRLPLVERTFPDGTVVTYEPGDAAGMAEAIVALADHPIRRAEAVDGSRDVVRAAAWEREAERYVALVDRLSRR